jgi:hypothetical protein
MLPLPLQDFQCTNLDYQTMEIWVNKIIRDRKRDIDRRRKQDFLSDISSIINDYKNTHVTGAAKKWDGVLSHPFAISAQGNSPYELSEIIRISRQRIILIAQNHRFMTDPAGAADSFRDQLFAKIEKGLAVDIIAMHPDARPTGADVDACKVWGVSSGSTYFDVHLRDCWGTLIKWSEKYKRESSLLKGELRILGAYMLPTSVNIVDPDSEDGLAVLSPRLTEQFSNIPRPQFIVTRRYERAVFDFYWGSIRTSFDNAGWKTVDKLTPYI